MRRMRNVALLACGLMLSVPSSGAALDLAGHWRVEIPESPTPQFVDVTQTGDQITLPAGPFPLVVSGGVVAPGPFTLQEPNGSYQGRLLGATLMDGGVVSISPPGVSRLLLGRCECFDGNTVDGDGCDRFCQLEPCFTCAGDPSVCSPSADGAACDDRHDCTTGETCSAGICGGGADVPGCVDLAGPWHVLLEAAGFGSSDVAETITQRNGVLRLHQPLGNPGGISQVGTIDLSTAEVILGVPVTNIAALAFCGSGVLVPYDLASGGATATAFSVEGTATLVTPMRCLQVAIRLSGTRLACGNGALDGGETCDDAGNLPGDGCSPNCQVEQCFACAGVPSVCTPTPAVACDDGRPCTTGDTCGATGTCSGSEAPDGTSCDADGTPCTGTATCQSGACVAGPPAPCAACERCDVIAGCVPAPRPACAATDGRRTSLTLRNDADDARDTISFKWEGAGVALGDPLTTDDYALCMFDQSSATPAFLFRAEAPAGGTCRGRPCWRETPTSASYRDKDASPEGLTAIKLKGGTTPSKVSVRGKGSLLSSRPFGLPAPPLPVPLLVQLQNVRGQCVEARFDAAEVIKNDPLKGRFKARATP